jgi:hypothetical protein
LNYVRSTVDPTGGGGDAGGSAEAEIAEFHSSDASGLYKSQPLGFPFNSQREELRIDVDGRYPQLTASGTIRHGIGSQLHWVASLTAAGTNRWTGGIWHKEGAGALLPHASVDVTVHKTPFGIAQTATVIFSGGGAADRVHGYAYVSRYFHPVEFEFDRLEGTALVTEIDTGAHPNRPVTVPAETLSIEKIFRRSGFNVSKSGGGGHLPLTATGADAHWSDMELHDAMQVYWSRFSNRAPWSMWVLFAAQHESGEDLCGIMFDDIGPNRRQGASLFNDSFIKDAPAGDPNPAAWAARSRFWTACHEMGHAFKLAHSWQRSLGTPWIPLADEPGALSFMNYYFIHPGGAPAFFADFEYRFSDHELLFMRHAPDRCVPVGDAGWFDHHGFQQAAVAPQPSLHLQLRVNRARAVFAFLEPVVLELKLTNRSGQPVAVDESVLDAGGEMTVIIKRHGKPARQWAHYARYCRNAVPRMLEPGESMYQSLFAAAGRNGWDLAEPGRYEVQVALHLGAEDIVSNRLALRIATPRSFEEENLAQDFFSDEVGRILTFDGSQYLESGNDTLREVVERLADCPAARHARVALAHPLARNYKQLALAEGQQRMTSAAEAGGRIALSAASADAAREGLDAALMEYPDQAAETLGHVDYIDYVDRFARWLSDNGDPAAAAACQARLRDTLANRDVASHVLAETARRRDAYRTPDPA